MSLQARHSLVSHPHTVFQRQSQRDDLLDPEKTRSELIALLLELIGKGHIILFTAIKTDHHDDSCLGFHSHFNGFDADVWFLKSTTPTDYLDSDDPQFIKGLADAAKSPWLYQIGLGGSSDTTIDRNAAGSTEFSDNGADHVHLGSGEK